MEQITHYFPDLTDLQIEQFAKLEEVYKEWNEKINVISRKDIEHLYLHHVLHSLSVGKLISFRPFTQLLDLGTGGGFPGIPLAILFPECRFRLIDGTGKKIKVVEAVVEAVGLKNVQAEHLRAEQLHEKTFDFLISRATLPLSDLVAFAQRLVNTENSGYNDFANGILLLKGGDLREEIRALPIANKVKQIPISDYFADEHFQEKYIVYVPIARTLQKR